MRILYSYLEKFIQPLPPIETGAALLTSCGLEVEHIEKIESVKGGLQQVVIGEVMDVIPHPDADRLRVTQVKVEVSSPALQIVCGAPNVAVGQKVVVALVGSVLYPNGSNEPLKIKKSKIRGVESNGMICAEDELGLGTSHDGILVLPADTAIGTAAAEYFELKSMEVMEIGLTPNRTDAMSHLGVARELSAVMKQRGMDHRFHLPFSKSTELFPTLTHAPTIDLESQCTLYSMTRLTIQPGCETPDWMKRNLEAIGLKCIHPVVDITNWVQHECGQPSHAFDADQLNGNIEVRLAHDQELLTTLDGLERKCSSQDVVIADTDQALCLAGVMGGKASGVSSNTKHVLLECALFDAVRVRKTSKFHGIHSDSSFRFERGVDPEMLELAQDRLIQLLQEICRAEVTGRSIHNPHPFTRNIVTFRPWKARLILGKEIADEVMQTILTSLDFEIQDLTSEGWNIAVPGCRVDVTREIDIIEEILRIYSFDEIAPSSKFTFSWKSGHSSHFKTQHAIIQNLVAQGCNEIQSLSLTKESYSQSENRVPVQILNPLSSDLGVLRTSMIHGGLEAISFNIKRKQSQLRLFEIGKTYFKEGDQFKEESHLSVWMTGPIERENAHEKMKEISFREMRHCAEQLAQMAGIQLNTAEKIEHPFFVECIQYPFKKGAMRMGWISPDLLKTHDIPQGVLYLELPLTPFIQLIQKHQPGSPILPKFPSVRRDLSMLIDRNVLFQDIEKTAYQSEKKWLKDVFLFDVYEGDKLPDGKKSYAVGFVLQDEQATMTDIQIDQCMQRILQKLNQQLGVELRS